MNLPFYIYIYILHTVHSVVVCVYLGEDLLWAMSTLGFNKYVEPLKHYLTKYREVNKEDELRKKQAAAAAAIAAGR